jgi:hypothetical protein
MKKVLLILLGAAMSTVSLLAQPVITSQPTNQLAILGGNATFGVTATGMGPLIYQWQLNGTNVSTNGIIITVAGAGSIGSYGDGSSATNAALYNPYAVVMDTMGNILIADTLNNRIRKVDTNGIMSTIAGPGTSGILGDGGAATNANLNHPCGLAVDYIGNVFVADANNYRVRKIDTNGLITTVAGTGSSGFSGDGGKATNAQLRGITGVAVDSTGNLFIADYSSFRIRKVDTNGNISTVAGNGSIGNTGDGGPATSAKLYSPYGVALDGSGNLFISSTYAIRKVDTNGTITTVAGTGTGGFSGDGGQATNATMWNAQGISVDTFGYIYIVDGASYRIRQVDSSGIITTVAGIGSSSPIGDGSYATNAAVYAPKGVALDNAGNILIADTQNNRIRKIFTGRDPGLRLKKVLAINVGNYQVIVTGPDGSVTSSNASLTLLYPPSITTEPTSLRVAVGSLTNLSMTVSGTTPLGYQWFASSGRTATAMPVVSSGRISGSFMIDMGAGYISTPQVHFVGGSGSGAAGTAIALNGSVVGIVMNNQGSGYTTASPSIQIDPPPTVIASLPSQTNAALTWSFVAPADGTNYFVVITNNYGSVTSSTVLLTVFLPPQYLSVSNVVGTNGKQFSLCLSGTPNYPYILQSATNLTPPISWKSIRTNYADTNGNWSFTVTNLSTATNLFFRAAVQ